MSEKLNMLLMAMVKKLNCIFAKGFKYIFGNIIPKLQPKH